MCLVVCLFVFSENSWQREHSGKYLGRVRSTVNTISSIAGGESNAIIPFCQSLQGFFFTRKMKVWSHVGIWSALNLGMDVSKAPCFFKHLKAYGLWTCAHKTNKQKMVFLLPKSYLNYYSEIPSLGFFIFFWNFQFFLDVFRWNYSSINYIIQFCFEASINQPTRY